jgi:hypothetical protein
MRKRSEKNGEEGNEGAKRNVKWCVSEISRHHDQATPMIGDGLFEYMSGLIGLMAKTSLLKRGVYALVIGLTVILYAADSGLALIFPVPNCDCDGIGRNISGYMLAPALRLLFREEEGCAGDGWERGRRASCERGGDSGILSLLRVSLRARRLGRSGGLVGVNIGAESKEDGDEAVDVVFSGV